MKDENGKVAPDYRYECVKVRLRVTRRRCLSGNFIHEIFVIMGLDSKRRYRPKRLDWELRKLGNFFL